MISEQLLRARAFEKEAAARICRTERPAFHLSAACGWMNDPNGLCYYDGSYHMYYQYYPYASVWGAMHWGHAVSRDLLHWDYLPCALAPDMPYDRDGCFSGSSIALPDGRRMLMYTGVDRGGNVTVTANERQTQCVAIGDGVDFEKYDHNPVIDASLLPEGASASDFRDPKIYREEDGSFVYVCVAGSRDEEGSGQILMFRSKDALHWEFDRVLAKNRGRFGSMWECPDFFPMGDKWVLLTSPQDMLPDRYEYHGGNGTIALIGTYDREEGFKEEEVVALDHGIDFYAPQTVVTPDKRRVMIGWMQNWDACAIRDKESPWAGQMSLPRELFFKDGVLCQRPVKEVEARRGGIVQYHNLPVEGYNNFEGVRGRTADLKIRIRPSSDAPMYHKLTVYFAKNERFHTALEYRVKENSLKIDREFSGSRRAIMHQSRCLLPEGTEKDLTLRIILDRYSAEVFVGDGERVMTTTIYTEQSADDIALDIDGAAVVDIEHYNLAGGEDYVQFIA